MKKYQLGLYEKAMPNTLTLLQKLNLTKETGFDFLELSIDETDEKLSRLDLNDEEIGKIKNLMEAKKVFIQSICLSGHRKYPLGSEDLEIQKRSLEIMEKAIQLAYRLGVRYIQIAGYDEYYRDSNMITRQNFLINLEKSVQMAASKGVILAFETMETDFMNTVEKSMYYIQKINSPYLKIYPDIGNLTNAAHGNQELVRFDLSKGKGHIVAAHLKETKPGIFRNLMFGQGHTNYRSCLDELVAQHVYLFVGEFWYNDQKQWKNNIKKAYAFLSKEIEEAIK